ncbi:MAG: HNH endonuclease [Armatimonadota bacterium]|nr:HNH endonuclease [Armatimonadota bacterium]
MAHEVLVLNSDYEPLNICTLRRAINLVILGKVDVLHEDSVVVHTVSKSFRSPSVIRLRNHVKRPRPQLRLSRRSILARDNYTCQYCGYVGPDLTVDHVVPKRLGGPTTWDNLVCCCKKCNNLKGDKTLEEAGFRLRQKPRKPTYVPFISLTKFVASAQNEVWRDYLPVFHHDDKDANGEEKQRRR